MRHDDRHVGEIHRDIIDVHGIAVLQANSAATRHAGTDAAVAGVKNHGQLRRGYHFIERIRGLVVGVKLL